MTGSTDRYALSLIQTGQAQKDVTHNDAISAIDTLLHLAVESIAASQPVAPLAGQCWIIASGATGAWAGRDGRIAAFTSAGWTEAAPGEGCLAWDKESGVFAIFRNGRWDADHWPVRALTVGGLPALGAAIGGASPPSGGSVIDAEARAAIDTVLTGLKALGLFA